MEWKTIPAKLKLRPGANYDTIDHLCRFFHENQDCFIDKHERKKPKACVNEFELIALCYNVSDQAAHMIWWLLERFRATPEYIKRIIEADQDPSFTDWQKIKDGTF